MEQTAVTPKKLKLPCLLEIAGAGSIAGQTYEISGADISLHSPQLAFPGAKKPRIGATALLTLNFRLPGGSMQHLKIPSRVAYVTANLIGVQINIQNMNGRERDNFVALLTSAH